MRRTLFSAAILAAVFGTGFAYAGQTTGTIKMIDPAAQTVTLDNGSVYTMVKTTDKQDVLGGYREGDHVNILWEKMGSKDEILAISPDFSAGVVGKVASVNAADGQVKLENGTAYTFQSVSGEKIDLSGFKPGDDVTIIASAEGGKEIGRAISGNVMDEVSGKVTAIDEATGSITLDGGKHFKFDEAMRSSLSGYKVGDNVKIEAVRVANSYWGRAISSMNG